MIVPALYRIDVCPESTNQKQLRCNYADKSSRLPIRPICPIKFSVLYFCLHTFEIVEQSYAIPRME